MADNFNLRQFLTENKLTKNAQLLNEGEATQGTDISQAFSNEGITGEVTVATIPSLGEEPKFEVMDAKKALAMIENEAEGAEKVTVYPGSKINRQGDYNRETKGLEGKLGVMIYSKSGNKAYEVYQGSNSLNESLSGLKDKYRGDIMDNKVGQNSLNAALEKDAEYNKLKPSEQKQLKTYLQGILNSEYNEGVKEKETVKENIMTQRDKYLTRLVENALRSDPDYMEDYPEEEELQNILDRNIDQAVYRGEAEREIGLEEGDEMPKETVIPEYNTVDELMREIDNGTNKVAEAYKISEMKKIAEALRERKNSLEESEHAQYMSKADLIKLGKDITAIDKAVTKLEAAFDKKFNKKTKSASAPKAEKEETPVALAEGFDLRNFLVENKLTSNSRMLNEYGGYAESLVGLVDEFYNNQLDAGIDPAELVQELTELIEYCNEQIQQLQSEM